MSAMGVSLIVAMDRHRGIGFRNSLPWKLSADLQLFKQRTLGHHIIVGRKTFDSIGRALPGRRTIIISRNPDYEHVGCDVVHSLNAALALANSRGETECFVCGGAEIYKLALPLASVIYLTEVQAEVQADTYFPAFNAHEWEIHTVTEFDRDAKNDYPFRVLEYRRSIGI